MANSTSGRRGTAVSGDRTLSGAEPPPRVKINKTTLRESLLIFRYVRPYRGQFAAGLLFIGLSSLSTMAFPYLLKFLIDSAGQRMGISGGATVPGGASLSAGASIPGFTGHTGPLPGHYSPGFLALC